MIFCERVEQLPIIGQYQISDVAIDCPDILLLRHAQLSIRWVAHGRYARRIILFQNFTHAQLVLELSPRASFCVEKGRG